jgi:hypothetical protein
MQKKDISYTTYIRDEGGCWLEKYIATEFKVISRIWTTTTDKLGINLDYTSDIKTSIYYRSLSMSRYLPSETLQSYHALLLTLAVLSAFQGRVGVVNAVSNGRLGL